MSYLSKQLNKNKKKHKSKLPPLTQLNLPSNAKLKIETIPAPINKLPVSNLNRLSLPDRTQQRLPLPKPVKPRLPTPSLPGLLPGSNLPSLPSLPLPRSNLPGLSSLPLPTPSLPNLTLPGGRTNNLRGTLPILNINKGGRVVKRRKSKKTGPIKDKFFNGEDLPINANVREIIQTSPPIIKEITKIPVFDINVNNRIEIDDFVYAYPELYDPDFQEIISSKKEFRDLEAPLYEPPPKRGGYFKHQLLVHRFMTYYDHLLVMHRAGTGKTGVAAGTSEKLKHSQEIFEHIMNWVDVYLSPERHYIKRAYILVKNTTLKDEFKRQILCKFSRKGDYDTEDIRSTATSKGQRTKITNKLKDFYFIKRHSEFRKEVTELIGDAPPEIADQLIREKYSGSLFIVDEAHNLVFDGKTPAEDQTENLRQRVIPNYLTLHRVFHVVERSKVMLMTATPMINKTLEIAKLLNLILPDGLQFPTEGSGRGFYPHYLSKISSLQEQYPTGLPEDYFDFATAEELKPYFNGRISYVREFESKAFPAYIGDKVDKYIKLEDEFVKSQTIMDNCEMYRSDFESEYLGQDNVYQRVKEKSNEPFSVELDQISIMTYPDGSNPKTGFEKYTIKRSGFYVPTPEFREFLVLPEYGGKLHTLSCKIPKMIRGSINGLGNDFIYTDYIHGSGAYIIAMAFQANGFEKWGDNWEAFNQASNMGGDSGLLCGTEEEQRDRTVLENRKLKHRRRTDGELIPIYRFAIIHGGKDNISHHRRILNVFNSWENRNGDLIKVLIVSRIGREGINAFSVRRIWMANPGWNPSNIYQALLRALRADSHYFQIDELRERGIPEEQISIMVEIHLLVASPNSEDPITESNDVDRYILAEYKDLKIKKVERMMKRFSIDFLLHMKRNLRTYEPGMEGTAECDYTICGFPEVELISDHIDTSSFDLLYSDEIVNSIILNIKYIMKYGKPLTFDFIKQTLIERNTEFRPILIIKALSKLIYDKEIMTDRFGRSAFLQENRGNFYLVNDYITSSDNYNINYYSGFLSAVKIDTIENIFIEKFGDLQESVINELRMMDLQSPEFMKRLLKLPQTSIVKLYEDSIVKYILNTNNEANDEFIRTIVSRAAPALFKLPTAAVNSLEQSLRYHEQTRGTTRGRSRKEGRVSEITEIDPQNINKAIQLFDLNSPEQIYTHTWYNRADKNESHGVLSLKSLTGGDRIRIFKPSEGKFREINSNIEKEVYKYLQGYYQEQKEAPLKVNGIYGVMSVLDDELKIRNELIGNVKGQDGSSNWGLLALIDIIYAVGLYPSDEAYNRYAKYSVEEISKALREGEIRIPQEQLDNIFGDEHKIRTFYIYTFYTKEQLFKLLRKFFEDNDRIMYV